MTFHYVNDGDVVIQGAETVNLIQKNNASLQKLLPKIVPSDNKKKLFIVGLFSLDLLKFLKRKFPLCDFEIRYYDVIKTDQLPSFKKILDFSLANRIKVSVYDRKTAAMYNVPYEMNKVNKEKLLPYSTREKVYDVCFLAGYSHSRAELLKPLLRRFRQAKLKVKILLIGYEAPTLRGK